MKKTKVAVVIPCFRVCEKIGEVLKNIPESVWRVYCVDDACPENSGGHIEKNFSDERVVVLHHEQNQGVGGAMVTGYKRALEDGADIVVKIDGDGQMNPALIPYFIRPIEQGACDYTKGNRFYRPGDMGGMPAARLLGNAALSFMTKLSSGYWHTFDPVNGFTAIHASVLREIPLDKLNRGYFFESDMLFRLNTLRAVVHDIPMKAVYADEKSSLNIGKIVWPFLKGHAVNFTKRVVYNYFLRDFSVASLELVLGVILTLFGTLFGLEKWAQSLATDIPASAGTVMLGALPIILGVQFLLSFLQYDIAATPKIPLHTHL